MKRYGLRPKIRIGVVLLGSGGAVYEIGVGRVSPPPPSEPYGRISRIRLSSQWFTLSRIDIPECGHSTG
jgi:hypothetical protein